MSSRALAAFLAHPSRPSGTLRYHELQGFLFAVATAPELIKPSEWLPVVFGQNEPEFASEKEAETFLGALMLLYNEVNASVRSPRPSLPPDCQFRRNVLSNFDMDAPVSGWSRGFLAGYQWLQDDWDECVPDDYDHDFGVLLMTLTFFATESLATSYVTELRAKDLEAEAVRFRQVFPEALRSFAELARQIQDAVVKASESVEPRTVRPTAGRNDPCPCGSGRKFKKCCGA